MTIVVIAHFTFRNSDRSPRVVHVRFTSCLDALIEDTMSKSSHTRHGAVIGLAETVLALRLQGLEEDHPSEVPYPRDAEGYKDETSFAIPDGTPDKLKFLSTAAIERVASVPAAIEKARLFRFATLTNTYLQLLLIFSGCDTFAFYFFYLISRRFFFDVIIYIACCLEVVVENFCDRQYVT